jgi:membrane protein YqaA with SNARE-associated domain
MYLQPNDSFITIFYDYNKMNPESTPDGSSKFNDEKGKSSGSGGNKAVIITSVIGIVLGAAIGYFISSGFVGLLIVILCTIGGGLLGGAVGNYLGEFAKKVAEDRRREKREH